MRSKVHIIFQEFGIDTLIQMAEVALKVPQRAELAEFYLDIFFKLRQNDGQFQIRALILKATLQSLESKRKELKADDNVKNAKISLGYLEEAIKLIAKNVETKKQFSFLIYNASLCVYNIIRPFFRAGWMNQFLEIVLQVEKLLDEVQEPDFNWKVRFSWVLFNCMYDSD